MTNEHDGIERRLRAALSETASQVQPSANPSATIATLRPRHPSRRGFVIPTIAAAVVLVVAAALTVGVVLLRGESDSSVRTPATEPKETSSERLLPLEADATVYMRSDASPADVDAVRDFLLRSAEVRRFAYVDKATAYEDFKRRFRDRPDLVNSIDASALPATFRIIARDCATRPQLIQSLNTLAGVDEAIAQLGLSRADAERFNGSREPLPPETRGRCGDQPSTAPSVGATYPAGG
jgi:hypothetical protein